MSATVDKAALQMLLAGHEIVHMTWSVGRAGWSVTAECHCGQVRPLAASRCGCCPTMNPPDPRCEESPGLDGWAGEA